MAPGGPPKTTPRRPQDASKNDLIFTSLDIASKSSPRDPQDPPKRPPRPPLDPSWGPPGDLQDAARGLQDAF